MQFSFAQEKTITGVVSDATGPLPGVNVVIKGTTRGVQTGFDGGYTIKAKEGETLVFTFLGMKDITRLVGATTVINVTMQDDATVLNEVVVVGYGTTTKEAYVGTADKIKSENVQAKSVANISQALKGEVAGVNVITGSGQPGSSATIRIRGFGSVNGNRDPLYVLDGVPFTGTLNSINPEDIESLTILKDATATSVYGARGANGVIVINTKKGKANRSSIEVDLKTSVNTMMLPRYDVIKSPEEFIGLTWESLYNRAVAGGSANPTASANSALFDTSQNGISPAYNMWNVTDASQLIDPNTRQVRPGVTRRYNPENWEDYAFNNSLRQEANVRFSGGNDKTRYFSSFGYLDESGTIVNSNFKRYSTRLNLSHQPKEWLKAGVNLGYTGSRSNNNGQSADTGSIFWFVDNIPSIYPLFSRNASGNMIVDPIYGGYQFDYGGGATGERGFGALTNAIADATYDRDRRDNRELNGSVNFDIQLFKGLNLETLYGTQYFDYEQNVRNNPFYGSSASTFGSLYKERQSYFMQNFLQLLRYKKAFGNHNFEAFVAHETNSWKQNWFSASKTKAAALDTFDLDQYIVPSGPASSYTDSAAIESYFGQLNYNYGGKYYLTATARRDGSSRFKNQKWDNFGSVGASWVISKEKFLDNSKYINYLKIKGSYGVTGDQEGVGLWPGYDTFDVDNLNDQYSIPARDNGNPDLTWETSKIAQVGLETTLFNNFLDLNVDYYVKNTDNLIFQRRTAISTGIAIITVNDGQLRNSGIEFDATAHILKPKTEGGLKLDFAVNGEILKNKITKMPIDPATGKPRVLDPSNAPFGWAEGHSIYDFYMREWAGVDAANGTALWYQYFDDKNGNGLYDGAAVDGKVDSMENYLADFPNANIVKTTTSVYADATQKFVGKSAIPKVRGAFRLNTSYKNFDLTTQFVYRLGGYVYDNAYAGLMANGTAGSNNWSTDIRGRWQHPGDITDIPRLSAAADANVASTSTRFLTKADYIGLNNVRLGYTMPSKFTDKLAMSKFNIFVSGDNLWISTKRKGLNPSTSESGNSNTYRYSPLSTFSMGLRLEF